MSDAPQVDDTQRRRFLATMEGALGLAPFDGDALPPWAGWLGYAVLRYRARIDRAAAALGGRTVIGRSDRLDEADLWHHSQPGYDSITCSFGRDHADHIRCRHGAGVEGDHVLLSPRWLDVSHLAFGVTEARWALAPYQRLARWIPSASVIQAIAWRSIQAHGGTTDGDWIRLPEAWEPLVAGVDRLDENDPETFKRLARAFNDVEVFASHDIDAIRRRRTLHDEWVDAWLRRGTHAGLDLAKHLYTGAELVHACERVMRANVEMIASAISVLHGSPSAPVSPMVREAVKVCRPDAHWMVLILNVAAPYLTRHGVDLEILRDKVRAVAATPRVELTVGRWIPRPVCLSIITWALRYEPAAALTLIREGLLQAPSWWVSHLIALLVMSGRPWCVRELQAARDANLALREELDHAIERCRLGDARLGEGLAPRLRNAVHYWQTLRSEWADFGDDFDPAAATGSDRGSADAG